MKKNKKIMNLVLGAAFVAGATLIPMRTAHAGSSQVGPSSSWTTTLQIGSGDSTYAKGWGTYTKKTVTFFGVSFTVDVPVMNVWLLGIRGVGPNSAGAVGVNSSGSVISTCKAVDSTWDLFPVVGSGSCSGAVKHYLQHNY